MWRQKQFEISPGSPAKQGNPLGHPQTAHSTPPATYVGCASSWRRCFCFCFHSHFQLLNIAAHTHTHTGIERWRIYSKWDIFMCIWQCRRRRSGREGKALSGSTLWLLSWHCYCCCCCCCGHRVQVLCHATGTPNLKYAWMADGTTGRGQTGQGITGSGLQEQRRGSKLWLPVWACARER